MSGKSRRCRYAHASSPVVDGALSAKVRPDECTWTLQDSASGDGRVLAVSLEKIEPRIWTRLMADASVGGGAKSK